MENLIIIGSGPAGLTAALYAARAELKPLVVDGVEPGGQLTETTVVENYPGFPDGTNGPDLMKLMRAQAERFGTRFASGAATASALRGETKSVTLDDGRTLAARVVIIATGASARYLGIESEQKLRNHGVSACATCDGWFYREKRVAVVGGGDTAMEEALHLTHFATTVTLIHRRGEFRASRIMAERALAHPKISVRWNTVVDEVLDVDKGEVTGLRLRDAVTGARSELPVDGLFLAIGHDPNTQAFAGQVELDSKGYVVVSGVRTSVDGVFAAGDVHDPVYRQAISAAGFGCMAALEATRYLEHRKS